MIKIDLTEILTHYALVIILILTSNLFIDSKSIWLSVSAVISVIPFLYYYLSYLHNNKKSQEEAPGVTYPIIVYGQSYINGYCKVYKVDSDNILKTNYIDKNGDLISNTWYNGGTDFNKFNLAIVKNVIDNEIFYYIINDKGTPIITNSFSDIEEYSDDGLCKVYWKDGTINFVDTQGNLLFSDWKNESNVKFTYE